MRQAQLDGMQLVTQDPTASLIVQLIGRAAS